MTAIQISGDGWPASALKGWGVVVEVDAANEVTVSVAGLDRAVAVGLLREAADALEGAPDEATATYEPPAAEDRGEPDDGKPQFSAGMDAVMDAYALLPDPEDIILPRRDDVKPRP